MGAQRTAPQGCTGVAGRTLGMGGGAGPGAAGSGVRVDHMQEGAWRKARLPGAAQTAVGAPVRMWAEGWVHPIGPLQLRAVRPSAPRMDRPPLGRSHCSEGFWFYHTPPRRVSSDRVGPGVGQDGVPRWGLGPETPAAPPCRGQPEAAARDGPRPLLPGVPSVQGGGPADRF